MADRFSALRNFSARTGAPRFRGRRPSARAVLAVGGAAVLAVVGVSETTGTMAAQTDSATAEVAQIASQNFFPTPLTSKVTCHTDGSGSSRRARVAWEAVPGATGYIVELVKKGTTSPVLQTYNVPAPTTSQGGISDSDRDVLYARVRTMNNGAISSGYMVTAEHISFKNWVNSATECEKTSEAINLANKTWENQADWTPGTPDALGPPPPSAESKLSRGAPADEVGEGEASSDEPTDDAAKPDSESTSPESTSPESTSPESTSSESTSPESTSPESTSPESTSPESTTPKLTTPESSTTQPSTTQSTTTQSKPEATVTIGISVRGDDRLLTVSRDGVEQCTAPLEPGDVPSVNGDTVALTNGGSVKTVDTTTCAVR